MATAAAFDLRPMSIGDILDRTIRLYRGAFLHTLGIVALPFLVAVVFGALLAPVLAVSPAQRAAPGAGIIAFIGLLALAFIWLTFVGIGALARSVSERFLGGRPTIWSAYRSVLRRGHSLIWAYILGGLAVAGGMGAGAALTFLVGRPAGGWVMVPMAVGVVAGAVWLVARLFLVTQVIVLEDARGTAALKRSWTLMRGNFWRVVLVLLFGVAINLVVSLVLEFPGAMLATMYPGPLTVTFRLVSSGLANLLYAPVLSIAFTLLYYDARIRREAFDLEVMARELGAPPPATAGPVAVGPALARGTPAAPVWPEEPAEPARAAPPRPPSPTGGALEGAAPPPPAGAAPAHRPAAAAKVCPRCGAPVPMLRPACPKCGAPVPFRPPASGPRS